MMRNPIYAGPVESPDYGVSTNGDFEPLVDEATFYRASGTRTIRPVFDLITPALAPRLLRLHARSAATSLNCPYRDKNPRISRSASNAKVRFLPNATADHVQAALPEVA
jgi:hypothetical protein